MAIVRLEGLGQLKKIHLIGTRTRDLPLCSIVPQPTTLPRAPWKKVNIKINFKEMAYEHGDSGVVRDGKGTGSWLLRKSYVTSWLRKNVDISTKRHKQSTIHGR
jgi:hypothetical protein